MAYQAAEQAVEGTVPAERNVFGHAIVVVPTRNNDRTIGARLRSFRAQNDRAGSWCSPATRATTPWRSPAFSPAWL